jgi:transcription antitermination factor NusG
LPWIVATTEPRREKWAEENVHNQGYETKLLLFIKQSALGHGKLQIQRPQILFPRYLFVHSPHGEWRFLLGTRGVTGVVMQGPVAPAELPQRVVDELAARTDEAGVLTLPKKPFKAGERVKASRGPFAGEIGIHEGMTLKQCECVLLDILGRRTRVLFDREDLEAA